MEPVHKLGLKVLGWGAALLLSFFLLFVSYVFAVPYIICALKFGDAIGEFYFVWDGVNGINQSTDD